VCIFRTFNVRLYKVTHRIIINTIYIKRKKKKQYLLENDLICIEIFLDIDGSFNLYNLSQNVTKSIELQNLINPY